MKLTWLGHSAVKIEGSRTVIIDPFLTNNPAAAIKADEITQADVVIVTHDHGDHLGDAFPICKRTKAAFFAIFELAQEAAKYGIDTEGMNVGGTIERNGVHVSLVPAFHTAGLGGTAVGAVIQMDGKSIYHAGDTGISMEMQLIGELYHPDIAFLPIDGRFNMTPRLAARAAELLNVRKVVPIHYNTFPAIHANPDELRHLAGNRTEVIVLTPGGSLEI